MTIAVLAAALAYLALLGLLFTQQRKMVFPAPKEARHTYVMQRLSVPTAAGETPALWLAPKHGRPVYVFFHGNGGQLADAEFLVQDFQQAGLGLFSLEYPGYPGAPGEPSEEAILAGASAGVGYLEAQLKVPPDDVLLFGQSLGTGVAVALAQRGLGRKLVLVSPYTSIADVARRAFPIAPGILVRDRFDSAEKAPSIALPVLIFHGTADEVVPFELGERLSKLFAHARLVPIQGGHHNDVIDRPEVLKQIVDFAGTAP